MSTDVVPVAESPANRSARLRIWPAIPFLIFLVAAKICQLFVVEWTPTLFMLLLFGPLVCMGGIALWWLFASRAAWRDRFLGIGGVVLLGVAAWFLADKSLRQMPFMVFVLPIGAIVFTAALVLLSPFGSRICTLGALIAAAFAFGYWDLVRFDGMSGDFKSAMHWRWDKTAEDEFLANLKTGKQTAVANTAEPLGQVFWPQFRGPNRDGNVHGVALDVDWKAHRPKEIWRRKVGPAWSSFCVAGNRLFTQEQRGEKEVVVCYDAKTGDERWVHESTERFWESMAGAGPRATPTVSGGHLYALGATGLLQRLNPLTGAMDWERDLKEEATRKPPIWGFSSSPLVVGDKVIVHAGGLGDKGLLAFDSATGEPCWSAPAGNDSYSSPQLANLAGRDVILLLANTGLTAIDAVTGKPAWNYEWKYEGHRVVQPLLVDRAGVLLGTGMGAGTRRLEIAEQKGDVRFEERWTSLDIKPDFNDYVAHKGFLYGLDHNILCCIDLETGKRKWKGGRYGSGQILLLPDADQLLVLSEMGELVLIQATPEKLQEMARQKVLDGKTWNHPVLVENRVFVRNGEEAACFELPLATQSPGQSPRKTAATEL
jgi:outer membrane protein assembly factor BamB